MALHTPKTLKPLKSPFKGKNTRNDYKAKCVTLNFSATAVSTPKKKKIVNSLVSTEVADLLCDSYFRQRSAPSSSRGLRKIGLGCVNN